MESYRRKQPKKCTTETVQGFITGDPIFEEVTEDQYSDGEDDFEFDHGSHSSVKKEHLRTSKVLIQTLDGDGIQQACIYVKGKFPFTGIWWQLTCIIKQGESINYLEGIPSYRLRSDLGQRYTVFSRLLGAMGLPRVERTTLESYIKSLNLKDYSSLYSKRGLEEMVIKCAKQQPTEPLRNTILALIPFLQSNDELSLIDAAIQCPVLMMTLPLLMPRMFFSVVKHGITDDGDPDFLPTLQRMILDHPWELAFSKLTAKRTGKFLPEVRHRSFDNANLWSGMKQPYKDAVMVYHVLQEHCSDTGDTYMSVYRLDGQSKRYGAYMLKYYRAALKFMKESDVIVEEDERIYVKSIYEAERNISEKVAAMLKAPRALRFALDFTKEPLSALGKDPDQRAAAEMISQQAVFALSGRGGSGKTEVVARVCQVLLEEIYTKKKLEYDDYMDYVLSTSKPLSVHSDLIGCPPQLACDDSINVSLITTKEEYPPSSALNDPLNLTAVSQSGSEPDLFDDDSEVVAKDWIQRTHDMCSDTLSKDLSCDIRVPACQSTQMSQLTGCLSSAADEEDSCSSPTFVQPLAIPDESKKSYILITAPTGKAAKVLGKRAGFTGFTIHQVLWRFIKWRSEEKQLDVPFEFSEVAILVVDECSLVAVQNLSFLLNILSSEAKLEKIIFLGDYLQLPSIDPGNFLTDLYQALSGYGAAITLRTNHRSEGRLIVENAIRISSRCMPVFNRQQNFCLEELYDADHSELERDEAVTKLIMTDAFKDDKKSQFVAFRRNDCEAVNNICSKKYTGKLCIDPSTKRLTFDVNFKICCTKNGTVPVLILRDPAAISQATEKAATNTEKIIGVPDANLSPPGPAKIDDADRWLDELLELFVTKPKTSISESSTRDNNVETNAQETNERTKKSTRMRDMRLCNGELFWLKEIIEKPGSSDGKAAIHWVLESEDGLLLCVKRKVLMKECRMKPCWCRTIHTFQGSEVKHLGYIVGAAGRQNWQHVYTAVTRGKSSVAIIGLGENLRKAINTLPAERKSSLCERLCSHLGVKPVLVGISRKFTEVRPSIEIDTLTAEEEQAVITHASESPAKELVIDSSFDSLTLTPYTHPKKKSRSNNSIRRYREVSQQHSGFMSAKDFVCSSTSSQMLRMNNQKTLKPVLGGSQIFSDGCQPVGASCQAGASCQPTMDEDFSDNDSDFLLFSQQVESGLLTQVVNIIKDKFESGNDDSDDKCVTTCTNSVQKSSTVISQSSRDSALKEDFACRAKLEEQDLSNRHTGALRNKTAVISKRETCVTNRTYVTRSHSRNTLTKDKP